MNCPACGTACPPAARHCPGCGIRLSQAAPASGASLASDAGPVGGSPGASAGAAPYVASSATPGAAGVGAALPPGALINGRYRVESVLGAGAFGRVYRAVDTQDPASPPLAIKELLDAQFASPDEKREAISWFKREVSVLLTLEHPGIPAVYGYWTAHTTSGPFYLAMEYVPGKTLDELLVKAGGRVPWPRVAEWGIGMCDVLAYLHGRTPPFIFRDVKLPNVLLDERSGRPMLIDFGIARQLAAAGGTAIGTWGYVPYEQVLGRAEPRSDLYALGATLHALLTGRRPDAEYTRLQREGLDVESAMRALFPPVETLAPDVPAALSAAIARATAFAVDDRFPDAAAMSAALASALGRAAATTAPLPSLSPGPMPPSAASALSLPAGAPVASPPAGTSVTPPVTGAPSLIVSKLGGGAFTTIGEAIRNASPGSRIEVYAGLYAESLEIDRPLEIVGIGRVDDVVVEATIGPCLVMRSDNARVRGLTLRGRAGSRGREHVAVGVPRGRLVLEECRVTSDSLACIAVHGAAADPVIRRCVVHEGRHAGIVCYDDARGAVEECDIWGHAAAGVEIRQGANPTLHRCAIHDGQDAGLFVFDRGQGTVEECEIYANGLMGVAIKEQSAPLLRRCTIRDGRHAGILVYENGQGKIEECDVSGNLRAGIGITRGGNPTIRRCTIHDGRQDGLFVYEGGRGVVEDCDLVHNTKAGVEITRDGDPTIRHCKIRNGQSAGVLIDAQGRGAIEDCNIVGNDLAGVEIRQGSVPMLTQCRISNNGLVGIWVHDGGAGTVEGCDLRGNLRGAWRIGFLSRVGMSRRDNRE